MKDSKQGIHNRINKVKNEIIGTLVLSVLIFVIPRGPFAPLVNISAGRETNNSYISHQLLDLSVKSYASSISHRHASIFSIGACAEEISLGAPNSGIS